MFAAFEAALKQSSKDEKDWKQTEAGLYAEPPEVKRQRRAEAASSPELAERRGRMSVGDAEAMLSRFAASDAQFR